MLKVAEFNNKDNLWHVGFMGKWQDWMFESCWSENPRRAGDYICCGHSLKNDFPFEPDHFAQCLNKWTADNGMHGRSQGVFYNDKGEINVVKIGINTNVNLSLNLKVMNVFWSVIQQIREDWIVNNKDLEGTGLNSGWPSKYLS